MLLSCLVVLRWGSSLWTCVNSRVHVAQNASTDQRSLPVFPGRGTVRKRHAKNSCRVGYESRCAVHIWG